MTKAAAQPAPVLVLDLGNSRAKWARFAGEVLPPQGGGLASLPQPLAQGTHDYTEREARAFESLADEIIGPDSLVGWVLTSVQRVDHSLVTQLSVRLGLAPYSCSPLAPELLTMGYATPKTLGADRYVAAAAAWWALGPGPVLSLDLGTAITYDYVAAGGDYRGGAIAPGLALRYRALHSYTARLPLLAPPGADAPLPEPVGGSTEASLRAGVELGLLTEIEGMLTRYRARAAEPLPVVVTGGDAPWLEKHAESAIFTAPNLVLQGAYLLYSRHRFG